MNPMSGVSLFTYLSMVAVGFLAFVLVLKLARTFGMYFLSAYLIYTIGINIEALSNLIINDLSADLLRSFSPQNLQPIYIIFGLVFFPLWSLAIYYYLVFAAGLLDKELSPKFRFAYLGFWVLFFAGFLTRIQFNLRQKVFPLSNIISLTLGTLFIVVPIAAMGYLIFQAVRGPRAKETKGLLKLALLSLAGYLLFVFACVISALQPSAKWATPLLMLAANLFPFLALKDYATRLYRPIPRGFAPQDMKKCCAKYRLSDREEEILGFLLKGKSNKDIERQLFISPHTVRNHIHNIYQKLEVGSRLQLMNLVGTWLKNGAESGINLGPGRGRD